ncbi:2'-5' RNA ligase [Methanococcus aeolicus Nankai-3]|uniref:RNA 2',3'-cyclic phosphodiesterase n=1 Tax=Methanococcus aeolicus (strain ATCC BAA-1280 / DSM 17508 / OCM 812 / Nankai-3) TaxID=419665 RepID=A6UVP3_META3|nr:RNA 2',3'-cyclic phosphodiesterase [Methanococcus aeolicus]ABR56565.1 2'-5' RNA ligase [Methanococcus aeolicus Nankai-3]
MRCFLAIELTDKLKEKIGELQNNFKINGIKSVEKENLHITVKFLGDIDDDKLEKIKLVDLSINPVNTPIKEVGVFPNENYIKIIWVGAPKLTNTLKEIDEKISELGFKKERSYIPHITIGRVKFIKDKNHLKEKIEKYKNIKFDNLEVKNIVLIGSQLTEKGPIYTTIKKW